MGGVETVKQQAADSDLLRFGYPPSSPPRRGFGGLRGDGATGLAACTVRGEIDCGLHLAQGGGSQTMTGEAYRVAAGVVCDSRQCLHIEPWIDLPAHILWTASGPQIYPPLFLNVLKAS
ncbi:hypothetical protein [Nitrosospira sp. NRS527]|uniref:hypothetical protein n=1 Tax=Nitrosospira sp. NRS527 TaxID=155925 RepID=UPI001AF0FB1F|nr:hypothetical protein [Nitrosospira sp. NRS527]BCT69588.1 hypothetical protein NNRS527_03213 [Nitrosospira sp. NRS527]